MQMERYANNATKAYDGMYRQEVPPQRSSIKYSMRRSAPPAARYSFPYAKRVAEPQTLQKYFVIEKAHGITRGVPVRQKQHVERESVEHVLKVIADIKKEDFLWWAPDYWLAKQRVKRVEHVKAYEGTGSLPAKKPVFTKLPWPSAKKQNSQAKVQLSEVQRGEPLVQSPSNFHAGPFSRTIHGRVVPSSPERSNSPDWEF